MKPAGDRVWRKTGRRTLRGIPTGRRAAHAVQTTYGRHQKERDRVAAMSAFFAERDPVFTGNATAGDRRRTEVLWSNRPFPQASLFDAEVTA